MATITIALKWEGPWPIKKEDIPAYIPDEEGIYMIICGRPHSEPDTWDPSSYKLLYIGEAEKVRSRIEGHEKWSCWNKNCANHILLKVARCKLGEENRKKVECCLIYKTKPTCNDECKEDFPYTDDTISITNTDMKEPLRDSYTC